MEKAILVSLVNAGTRPHPRQRRGYPAGWSTAPQMGEEDVRELELLTISAGAEVVDKFIQRRKEVHSAYYIGKGKTKEIANRCLETSANLVVFNAELSPAQQRNLEKVIKVKVIDRTDLILDIFAQRARTSEGKLQVELAQMMHLLPRLTGHGILLSQLGGGIGTRGPGETKLEYDRRRVRKRIDILRKEIENIRKRRLIQKESRFHYLGGYPLISLVGYTNTGKSTLLNVLSGAQVLVDDKLFATLDPTTRKIKLPNHQEVLLTDTVGFIRNLPHHLVAAFHSTLEEVRDADLLLHIVDISSYKIEKEIDTVYKVLKELEADKKPIITVFNKKDKIKSPTIIKRILKLIPDSIAISALYKDGTEDLLEKIADFFEVRRKFIRFSIPYQVGMKLLPFIYRRGGVLKKEILNGKIILDVKIDTEFAQSLKEYIVKE